MDSIGDIIGRLLEGVPQEEIDKAFAHSWTAEEWAERRAAAYNGREGELGYLDCPKCKNRGDYAVAVDGEVKIRTCPCMIKRENMRRLSESGLSDVVMEYTFSAFETPDSEYQGCKDKAMEYTRAGAGQWLFATGKPGSGKTHLCTAVAAGLIRQCYDVRYVIWREIAPRLKALVNEREQYETEINTYKTVDVLYIDDLFKGPVSSADINLAYEIINARYGVKELRTIISTERSMQDIIGIDEALGSRIYQRSKNFIIQTPKQNWRLK